MPTNLTSDPSLPEADYLRHCIYRHLPGLRKHEPQKMRGFADSSPKHPDPALRRIGGRTQALASGELDRKDRVEATQPKRRRKP